VAVSLDRLPRYLVLEPMSTVRFEISPVRPSSMVDVALENPAPGRSFLLLVGPPGGPLLQRMRLTGAVRILFRSRDRRPQVLMLANPRKEPLVLRLGGRLGSRTRAPPGRSARRPSGPSLGNRPSLRAEVAVLSPRGEVVRVLGEPARRSRPKG